MRHWELIAMLVLLLASCTSMEAKIRASLEEAGGYGRQPTDTEMQAAVERVRTNMNNPLSFELLGYSLEGTRSWLAYPSISRHYWVHGWQLHVRHRGTNSYGGIVTRNTLLLLRNGGIVMWSTSY